MALKKNIIWLNINLLFAFLLMFPSYAIDINQIGDFSSRSLIIKNNNNPRMSPELITKLRSQKLYPTTQCLIEQINKNNKDNIILLLETNMDLNEGYYGDFPIHKAARKNNFEIVQLLYQKGAKLDRGFYSELYEAVLNKNEQMAQFLLDNNAKVDYRDSVTNNSILTLALKNRMDNIARQLIKKGASIDNKTIQVIKKRKLDPRDFM